MSVASEYDRAEQVVADVALLHDIAAGRLDEQRVRDAARVLLEHRRHELPSVSVAVAARLLEVSRTTVEAWRQAGVLAPAPPQQQRRRHEVTVDSLVRVQALLKDSGGSERIASCGTTSGGPRKTPRTTPTASSPRRWPSCARGNSARSTCHRMRIWNGHAASSAIQPPRSSTDCCNCPDEASQPADRLPARQGQGLVPISGPGHTPPRMRGSRCPANGKSPVGDLQAGSVRCMAPADRLRGTGPVHPAALCRARALLAQAAFRRGQR